MRPIYGCPENFWDSLTTPTATFHKIFHGLLLWLTLWCAFKISVASPVLGLIGGSQKWSSPWLCPCSHAHSLYTPKWKKIYHIQIYLCALVFSRFLIAVLSGGCEPQILGKGRPYGSGIRMVPFERALVSFYRPSIVTFPLSLCVSEILPLLCSSTPLFPTSPSLPKISHVPPGVSGSHFRYKERRCWLNCLCN